MPDGAPFGRAFGDLVGVGERVDIRRLRLWVGARLVAGLAFWWSVQASQGIFSSFRINYVWIVWASAVLPVVFALTFRWLRNPLLAIGAGAVIASFLDPAFYRPNFAMLTLSGNVVGSLVLAAAIGEIERTRVAIWLGAATASLSGILLGWLVGFRMGGWHEAGPSLYRATLLSVVFTAVWLGGLMLTVRAQETQTT